MKPEVIGRVRKNKIKELRVTFRNETTPPPIYFFTSGTCGGGGQPRTEEGFAVNDEELENGIGDQIWGE